MALTALINDLHGTGRDLGLVLDDYHAIDAPDIDDGVTFLLDHVPDHIHLVISTRADPALPVARLRVTLAMNGWAGDEPAWWLNLQAHPDATVAMKDGTRHVRARSASGLERDRLWEVFDRYPGWGDDLDALSAMRSRETAIVVLEPLSAENRGKNTHFGSTIER